MISSIVVTGMKELRYVLHACVHILSIVITDLRLGIIEHMAHVISQTPLMRHEDVNNL